MFNYKIRDEIDIKSFKYQMFYIHLRSSSVANI